MSSNRNVVLKRFVSIFVLGALGLAAAPAFAHGPAQGCPKCSDNDSKPPPPPPCVVTCTFDKNGNATGCYCK